MLAYVHVSTHRSQKETSQVDSHFPTTKDRISLVCFSDQLLQASRLTSLQPVLLSTSLCFDWDYRCILLHLAFCVGSGDRTQALWPVLLLIEPSPPSPSGVAFEKITDISWTQFSLSWFGK